MEWEARWNRDSGIRAEKRVDDILEEIARSYGPSPSLFSLEKGVSFANDVVEIAEDPTSWKAWVTAIGSLPFEVAKRLIDRRPVVEIHELKAEIPGPLALRKTLEDLFGPYIDE